MISETHSYISLPFNKIGLLLASFGGFSLQTKWTNIATLEPPLQTVHVKDVLAPWKYPDAIPILQISKAYGARSVLIFVGDVVHAAVLVQTFDTCFFCARVNPCLKQQRGSIGLLQNVTFNIIQIQRWSFVEVAIVVAIRQISQFRPLQQLAAAPSANTGHPVLRGGVHTIVGSRCWPVRVGATADIVCTDGSGTDRGGTAQRRWPYSRVGCRANTPTGIRPY
jgi:hypothetical protein